MISEVEEHLPHSQCLQKIRFSRSVKLTLASYEMFSRDTFTITELEEEVNQFPVISPNPIGELA